MYNSKTIRAVMLTNTTTFSFFFLWLISPSSVAVQTVVLMLLLRIVMNVHMYALAHKRLLVPAIALSLCYTRALSLSLWGCWLNDTEFYLGAFGCQLLCGELHTYSTVWMFVHLCLWKRFYWLVSAVERGRHREKERERWRAPIVDRQLFWFFNLTTTAGNRQRTHVQMYTCTHCT